LLREEALMNPGSTLIPVESTAPAPSRLRQSFRSYGFPHAIYALAIAAAILVWLQAIRAPLGMDETGSYWQISAGFSAIWPRQFAELAFPAYSYILWFFTQCLGKSEMALRIPSLLAMLGAAWVLYRAARELLDAETSLLATAIFCINPIVVFEAVDVRPYAFAVLATNIAIFLLLRLRRSGSQSLAALFGFVSAFMVYFHHLFAAILPAFLLCFLLFKRRSGRRGWMQAGVALTAFCVSFLPLIPGLKYLFHTAHSHVYEAGPDFIQLLWTLAPGWLFPAFVITALLAWAKAAASEGRLDWLRNSLLWASLGLIPVLILFGISKGTSIHMFAIRHRLVAVPGISLAWAVVISYLPWRLARPLFCAGLVAMSAASMLASHNAGVHAYTWKYALQTAEKSAAVDHAPVVMCSPFIESDYAAMPVSDPTQSLLFAPITYYKLSERVIPLPLRFTSETTRVGSEFLQAAARQHERFLVVAYTGNSVSADTSFSTIQWIEKNTRGDYDVHWLGVFDEIGVVEFVPRGPVGKASH
jgi:hypothetical protein